ncbi:MAG TPA: hypothetical protein VFD58_04255 [Blastocatellia bacterium]|nr:hypothetical protein [Blastocatellia bacterium]
MQTVPRFCTLDGFVEISETLEGVELRALAPNGTILVRTRESDYRILLLDPASRRVLIEGGPFFAEPTEAILSGSSFGGCLLRMGWIGHGLRMEIHAQGRLVVTSPVRSLRVEGVARGAVW